MGVDDAWSHGEDEKLQCKGRGVVKMQQDTGGCDALQEMALLHGEALMAYWLGRCCIKGVSLITISGCGRYRVGGSGFVHVGRGNSGQGCVELLGRLDREVACGRLVLVMGHDWRLLVW